MQKKTKRDSRHNNNPTNRRPTKMFSLERLLIAFSAFLGDSISKTPKVHVLVCLCAFGLLAVGIVLVEIEHDVFKLWVRFRSRYHLVSNEIFFSSRYDDVFLSSFSRSSEKELAGQKQKRAHTRQRKEFVRRVLSFFPSLIQNGGGRGNQFPLLFSLIFPYLKEPFLDFFLIFS